MGGPVSTSTPDPTGSGVSSVPDTEALQHQAAKDAATSDAERVDAIRSGTLDDAANAVFEALGGYPGPEIVTFRQALDAVRKQRADLDQSRAEIERLTTERGALSRMLRGMARRVGEVRDEMRFATSHIGQWQKVAQRLRSQRDSARVVGDGAGTGADDAAERLRKLAADFRSRSDQAVVDALAAEPGEDECDSPAECHGAAACWAWKLAARQVEKLADALATPAADPAPTDNLRAESLQEQADLLAWTLTHIPPGTRDREDIDTEIPSGWWIVGHGEDPDHPVVQVHLGRPAAPQASAEPTACGQVHDGQVCTRPRQAGTNGCWGHYGPEVDPDSYYVCDIAKHVGGQVPCPHCEPIPGRPLPAGLAAREDTAPPAPAVHEVTVRKHQFAEYFSSHCTVCGTVAGDSDEQWVQDRADAHRADNLIPARPPALAVDGDHSAPSVEEA